MVFGKGGGGMEEDIVGRLVVLTRRAGGVGTGERLELWGVLGGGGGGDGSDGGDGLCGL